MSDVEAGEPISAKAWNELPEEILRAIFDSIDATPPLYLTNLGDRLCLRMGDPQSPGQDFDSFVAIPRGGKDGACVILTKKGTVNDLADGAGLTVIGDAGDPPDNFWEFHLPAGSTRYLYEDAEIDPDGTITAVTLRIDPSPPTTDPGDPDTGDPPSHAYRKLWKAVVDNDYKAVITQYTKGAQQAIVIVSGFTCEQMTKNVLWLP